MHLFDSKDQLRKYSNVEEIVHHYYDARLALYEKRKSHQLAALAAELRILSNKARYIQEVLDGSIDLRRKRGDDLVSMLREKGYDALSANTSSKDNKDNKDNKDGDESAETSTCSYKYLLKLPMDSVSEENVARIMKEKGEKESQYSTLKGTGIEQLWLSDLAELREEYMKQETKRTSAATSASAKACGSASSGASGKKPVKATASKK
jgi:DNA topoisomerase-2